MSFESYPQLILGTYIIIGLQINQTMNYLSCSISAASAVYGFGDMLAFFANDQDSGAPLILTVWGVLATTVDTMLRALFMSYLFSIIKAFAFIILPIYFLLMYTWYLCKNQRTHSKIDGVLFTLMSFGCSAVQQSTTAWSVKYVSFKFRFRSKLIFGLIFLPSLFLVTHLKISPLTNNATRLNTTDIDGHMLTNATIVKPKDCLNICKKDASTIEFCGSLWKHMGDSTKILEGLDFELPEHHLTILKILVGLFILSTFEGLLDACVHFTASNILDNYKPTSSLQI